MTRYTVYFSRIFEKLILTFFIPFIFFYFSTIRNSIITNFETMMYNVIVVFILCFLKDAYAQQCTQPPVPMCTCFLRTNLFCSEKNLTQVPSNIPATTTQL